MNESVSTSTIIESEYKLALKFFMNKNFNKAFEMIKVQYQNVFNNYQAEIIEEKLYYKIIDLYLIIVGMILLSNEVKISKSEKTTIVDDLKNDVILNNLSKYKQDEIPTETIFNLYLTIYIGLDIEEAYEKFMKMYPNLEINDIYTQKWLELLILKILPGMNKISDGKQLVRENNLDERLLDRLQELEKEKDLEFEKQQNLKHQRTRDQKKKESQAKLDKDLKYKSLKQIRESSEIVKPEPQTKDIETLKDKLLYQLKLTRNYLQNNSPILAAVVIMLLIVIRILRVKKVNIGQSLKETLKMAFKISYL
ncbi:hypothetical protein CLIB1444_07S01970 [[Candida] jaroonii]|uniref:Uncharacterized protein n=1 Tax=[Candida] jaroonii TaxID=467808 RepID=A0ACA9YAP4_9ASCO|nr:hypothetical protein CLIB1444_07S01970 [[Candida] jaroonii]